jgi:hypothetical protein
MAAVMQQPGEYEFNGEYVDESSVLLGLPPDLTAPLLPESVAYTHARTHTQEQPRASSSRPATAQEPTSYHNLKSSSSNNIPTSSNNCRAGITPLIRARIISSIYRKIVDAAAELFRYIDAVAAPAAAAAAPPAAAAAAAPPAAEAALATAVLAVAPAPAECQTPVE